MVGGGREIDPQDEALACGIDDVRVRGRSLIFAKLHVAIDCRQVNVELAVLGKARMEGEAEQALLAVGGDLRRDVEKRRRFDLTGREIHYPDQAGLLDDEEAPRVSRRRRREKRLGKAGRDPHRAQSQRLGRRIRVPAIDDFGRLAPAENISAVGVGANDPRDHGKLPETGGMAGEVGWEAGSVNEVGVGGFVANAASGAAEFQPTTPKAASTSLRSRSRAQRGFQTSRA